MVSNLIGKLVVSVRQSERNLGGLTTYGNQSTNLRKLRKSLWYNFLIFSYLNYMIICFRNFFVMQYVHEIHFVSFN